MYYTCMYDIHIIYGDILIPTTLSPFYKFSVAGDLDFPQQMPVYKHDSTVPIFRFVRLYTLLKRQQLFCFIHKLQVGMISCS